MESRLSYVYAGGGPDNYAVFFSAVSVSRKAYDKVTNMVDIVNAKSSQVATAALLSARAVDKTAEWPHL
jgi:hypothetical protein